MESQPLRITGNYSIASTFRSIAPAGPECKPYLTMTEEAGKRLHKVGRNAVVRVRYSKGFPSGLELDDPNVTEADLYLVFLSFDHHRMRLLDATPDVEVLSKYGPRMIVTMNNVDSEVIYGVPKHPGVNYRCWVDDIGMLCHEPLEVSVE